LVDWCEVTPLVLLKRWRRDLYQPRARALGYDAGKNQSAVGAIYPGLNLIRLSNVCGSASIIDRAFSAPTYMHR